MPFSGLHPRLARGVTSVVALALVVGLAPAIGQAQTTAFTQALAAAASQDDAAAAFYRDRTYAPFWTGAADEARREAFLSAVSEAHLHALPVSRYDATALAAVFHAAETEADRGRVEAAMTRAFLAYARDIGTGVLTPQQVDAGIVREVPLRDPQALLAGFAAAASPEGFLRDLAPKAPEYSQLIKAKMMIEAQLARGGWGVRVAASSLQPGAAGDAVVQLRDRLDAMGYLTASATATYDDRIKAAVTRFQLDHGQIGDGVAGEGTIIEINVAPQQRLEQIVVAMERLRWMGDAPRGARHIWVNLPDMTAQIVDKGRVTFKTRAVIGENVPAKRTPEFSDSMDHMVINPSWGVPRSIIVSEYLPQLQRNPNAVSHMQVIDNNGRVVPRGAVNFAAYSARSFPFGLRQPPSDNNALGKVKFMFPNKYNIYLHDTPAKSLFSHDVRTYSHGCIRLAEPFDFAYTLLAAQVEDEKAEFARYLEGGRESPVKLQTEVPVHLVYFTAWPTAKGQITYRRDIYGRDAAVLGALQEAGVVLRGVQG